MIVCSRLLIPSLFDEFYDNTHSYQNSTIKIVTREKIRDIVFDTSSNSIYKLEINMNENSILTEIYDGKCFNIRKYSGHLEKFSTSLSGYFSGRVQFKIPVDFLFCLPKFGCLTFLHGTFDNVLFYMIVPIL